MGVTAELSVLIQVTKKAVPEQVQQSGEDSDCQKLGRTL